MVFVHLPHAIGVDASYETAQGLGDRRVLACQDRAHQDDRVIGRDGAAVVFENAEVKSLDGPSVEKALMTSTLSLAAA